MSTGAPSRRGHRCAIHAAAVARLTNYYATRRRFLFNQRNDHRGVRGKLIDPARARRAHQVQSVRQQRQFEVYAKGSNRQSDRQGWNQFRRRRHPNYSDAGRRRATALQGESDQGPDADRHLQRHANPADGIGRDAVLEQRAIRGALSGGRPRRDCAQPSRPASLAADPRSSSDQPHAVHARRRRPRLRRRVRHAGIFEGSQLRLQESLVDECAGHVDPVHDARLVLASSTRATTTPNT